MSRAALAAAVAVIVLVAGTVLVLATSGSPGGYGGGKSYGRVTWAEKPKVYRFKTIPDDRVLSGRLRNDSFKEVDLVARRDVKLVDAAGRAVEHAATFTPGYGRDIYPPRYLRQIPEADQLRLGIKAKIKPGKTAPFTLTWRVRRGGRPPTRIELPGGVLSVPSPD